MGAHRRLAPTLCGSGGGCEQPRSGDGVALASAESHFFGRSYRAAQKQVATEQCGGPRCPRRTAAGEQSSQRGPDVDPQRVSQWRSALVQNFSRSTTMKSKPLAGCVVGISISESEEMERLGFDRREMNRCVVRLSELLLAAGARLAFGHDWRPGGVMEAVAALAVRYFNVRRNDEGRPLPEAPIINRVDWMRQPFLAEVRRRDSTVAEEWPAEPPPMARLLEGIVDARAARQPASGSSSHEQAVADGLTEMRKELAELCHLRICLGGKVTGYSGRKPGIVEEAWLTLTRERPVLASTVFGGASRVVVCG